jgi:hypothetical protein
MVPLSITVHFFAGDALADQSGERRSLLAIEIGFQAVTDGFVQQDAGPSRAENHFHFTGGGFTRVELKNRLAGRFFGEVFWILVSEEEIESDASAAAGAAASGIVFGFSDTRHVHARQRLGIFGEGSVGGDDKNVP